jgi:16S rRNA processing protein RimM
MRGHEIAVPRSEFPEPDEDEFYWTDLIGLQVFNKDEVLLGKVDSLLETGANDVLVVKDEHGKKRMIPFVGAIVLEVDIKAGRIVADWGLDY